MEHVPFFSNEVRDLRRLASGRSWSDMKKPQMLTSAAV